MKYIKIWNVPGGLGLSGAELTLDSTKSSEVELCQSKSSPVLQMKCEK